MARSFGIVLHLFASSSRVQRKRAALTIAAIAWGTLTLLLLLAFGEGLSRQLRTASAGMGTNLAVIWPGETGKIWRGLPIGRPIRPTIDDVEALSGRIPGARAIIPEVRSWQSSMTWGTKTVTARVLGTTPAFGEVRNHIPQTGGRFLNEADIAQRRRVLFLGNDLAKQIFGAKDPVGEIVQINSVPYTVIGVMKKKLQMGTYGGPDEGHGVIPVSTFRAQFGRERVNNILIAPESGPAMAQALTEFKAAMGRKYAFDPEDERAFGIWNTVETSKMFNNIVIGIQVFLGIIGALTLLVGGVGVANIMYAVVNERTREIGVKMALGARRGWITGPFVMEALVFTLTGGMVGLCCAIGMVALLGMIPTEGNEALQFLGKPVISPAIGIASAAVLGFIGLAAGYFPARRAAAINPAETLRYE